MYKQPRNNGPRCGGCGRPFQPRQMRDGKLSQTCGQTACVSLFNRKKSTASLAPRRPQPQNAW